ncbi:MAG: hypothetical protein U9O95_07390 [Candidatus Marinimicrobia bacterium]|nr:hypothetical protein [Candidatus Neomarinimicrobiota bacterium]
MKRVILVLLLCLSLSSLFAYELGTESYNRYTIFDPDMREMGLVYPVSWLWPGSFLFQHEYEDSSYSYVKWDQIFTIDQTSGDSYNFSSDVVVKYLSSSSSHHWSVGLKLLDYKGPNSTLRNDAVIHYKHNKGSFEYFHTNNTQSIALSTGTTKHHISSHGINFDYQAGPKIQILGGVDFNLISQQDTSTRNYDTHHEFAEIRFKLKKPFMVYGKFEHRHFWNNGQESSFMVFRPGARYQSPKLIAHLAFRISPKHMFPIAQIIYRPKPFFIETYVKVRTPRIILMQPGHQYIGTKTGIKLNSKRHYFYTAVDAFYDFVRKNPMGLDINNDFYGIKANAEYRLKTSSMEFYGRAFYNRTFDELPGYYHPEHITLTGGLDFHSKLIEGKLLLEGDMNAQYIIHNDPDDVAFNPSTLTYTLLQAGNYVGDWKINMRLKAKMRTFAIALDISTPLKSGEDQNYYFYEGIYTSSDFVFGNTFYAGLNIEWGLWK